MIAIIDYRAGNLASVSNALNRLMTRFCITRNIADLDEADGVIFPGVGHAESAMKDLAFNGLDTWFKSTEKPVLGICLGMQLFYDSTAEGPTNTLGVIPGKLKKFDSLKVKVPHMGWNTIHIRQSHPLLDNIPSGTHFYHVHSYYAPVSQYTIAESVYTEPFSAISIKQNFMGVQFHPEKSGPAGERLLRNFLNFVYGGMHSATA